MRRERNIFGFRHHSNVDLYPSPEDLAAFIAGPASRAGRVLRDEIAAYRALIDNVRKSERPSLHEQTEQDAARRLFFTVLGHTGFASAALAAEVEYFSYFLHTLKAVDLRKPWSFIRAAEEEIAKLNMRKRPQAERIARLRELSDARKRDLDGLRRRREMLSVELVSIAQYVRDNLVKIGKLCRTSLIVLSDVPLAGKIEKRLVEDMKEHFRHFLKASRGHQKFTAAYLEGLKADVATLAQEITSYRREAAAAAEQLYQSLFDHAEAVSREIDSLLAQIGARRCEGDATDQQLFDRIEQQLISLVSGYRLEGSLPERHTATSYQDVFNDKKREALDSLVGLMLGERRSFANRRSGRDRRVSNLPPPNMVERRRGKERRAGRDRRIEDRNTD